MRESSLVFRLYLVCPLYLLALLASATKFVAEPRADKDNLTVGWHARVTARLKWSRGLIGTSKCAEAIL